MKRIITFLLAIAMLFSLAACSDKQEGTKGGENKRESAQTVVEKAIQAVQELDEEGIQKYWGTTDDDTADDELSELDSACIEAMFKNLSYKIVSCEEKKTTATVKVEFTNIDIPQAFSDTIDVVFAKILEKAFAGEEDFDENAIMCEELLKALNSGDYGKVTKEVTINLSLEDDNWVIDPSNSDEVFNAMLADINTFLDSLNDEEDTNAALISEVEDWLIGDIWNDGFCELQWYYEDGTSATGGTLDAELTIKQLAKAMEKKADYDTKMAALPEEYSEVVELWEKVSEQIDVLYAAVQEQGTSRNGAGLDVDVFYQYFEAFEDAVYELN